MAPKKGKNQAKRSNIKIKGKSSQPKRGLSRVKSRKLEDKIGENQKWCNKSQGEVTYQKMEGGRDWVNDSPYKKDFASSSSSEADTSGYMDYATKEVGYKSCLSDASEECNCTYDKYAGNKYGILKRKDSSANSLVAKYLKSGMDHVASFIVESAIRFGEQHGVVVPDKNTPNVYEITPPDDKRFFDDKTRRIRFKIPEKGLDYNEIMMRSRLRNQIRKPSDAYRKALRPVKEYEIHAANNSLNEIIPLLKKMKKEGKPSRSEMNFQKLESSSEHEHAMVTVPVERERKKQREQMKGRDKDIDRLRELEVGLDRGRERDEERRSDADDEKGRARQKARERIKKKIRALRRFKSVGADLEEKSHDQEEYSRTMWKKYRQDSLELGRQRLRASTCPRKSEELSPSSDY